MSTPVFKHIEDLPELNIKNKFKKVNNNDQPKYGPRPLPNIYKDTPSIEASEIIHTDRSHGNKE